MQLQLLCVGDVVGSPGRRGLQEALPVLTAKHAIDCVIVNAENVTQGAGLAAAGYEKVIHDGANLITLGDHVYRRRDIIPVLERAENIVRPANLPSAAPGREFAIHETAAGRKVAVISLLGRMFMQSDCASLAGPLYGAPLRLLACNAPADVADQVWNVSVYWATAVAGGPAQAHRSGKTTAIRPC